MYKKSEVNHKDFMKWVREVINPQANKFHSNSVNLDDNSKDGNTEYSYPKDFKVLGQEYSWTYTRYRTKRRYLCSHYELWFHGPGLKNHHEKIATGKLTKYKIWKGLKKIYVFYYPEGRN